MFMSLLYTSKTERKRSLFISKDYMNLLFSFSRYYSHKYLIILKLFHYATSIILFKLLVNPLVPELFGRARKNLIVDSGMEYYRFIFLTRCWLGKPHSNHISLNRPRVWDSPHFLIEKIE